MAIRPCSVDFNELTEFDVVLLSQTDVKKDVQRNDILLSKGFPVAIYSDYIDRDGRHDSILVEGVLIRNT
jgi:hypothetical protein